MTGRQKVVSNPTSPSRSSALSAKHAMPNESRFAVGHVRSENLGASSFVAGRPESVIGNKLFSMLSLLGSRVDLPFEVTPRLFALSGPPRCGMEIATKIRSAVTIAPAPMITNRFCWICCFALCLALVANSGKAAGASGGMGTLSENFISVWLLHESDVAVVTVSVGASHFAPPVTGATNAIGAKTGRSTSSAWATASNNRSLDSLKLGRSNTTTPSALAPGASLRAVIQ